MKIHLDQVGLSRGNGHVDLDDPRAGAIDGEPLLDLSQLIHHFHTRGFFSPRRRWSGRGSHGSGLGGGCLIYPGWLTDLFGVALVLSILAVRDPDLLKRFTVMPFVHNQHAELTKNE